MHAHATAKYVRTSAQKAGLVLDLIRGRDVNTALATLRFARKAVAKDIEKVLRSAIANAQQKDGFGGDVERLVVNACYANQGPSQKRIRPAPMGRAFRVVKRTAHLPSKSPSARRGHGRGRRSEKRPRGAKPKRADQDGRCEPRKENGECQRVNPIRRPAAECSEAASRRASRAAREHERGWGPAGNGVRLRVQRGGKPEGRRAQRVSERGWGPAGQRVRLPECSEAASPKGVARSA